VIALVTLAVIVIRIVAVGDGTPNRWDISALPFLTFHLGPAVLGGAGLVAAAGVGLCSLGTKRWRVQPATVTVALFLPVTVYTVWNPIITSERAVYPSGWQSPQAVAARYKMRTIAYDRASYDVIGLYATQWFLPHTSLTLFNSARSNPGEAFVISGAGWSKDHRGYRVVWRDIGRNQELWVNSARTLVSVRP
jgi:hypothetical protein